MAPSPYRLTPDQLTDLEVEDEVQPLETVDVSGPRGADARHGADGRHGSGFGQGGGRGGDAGRAERGRDAGAVRLEIETAQDDGIIRLGGITSSPDGATTPIESTMTIGTAGFIELGALGGGGGTGGNGGDGGDGAAGYDGEDATRWSDGTDGGHGGNGGDGGRASSGAGGGHGGQIVVEVDERDTQLLMLVRHDIRGGVGGAAGRNGAAGSGGAGGNGGDSYSWTTTNSWTDSDGNTHTDTDYHHRSGGIDGPWGSSGRSGDAHVEAGTDGKAGSFEIRVESDDGVDTFASRYDLRLRAFEHDSHNADCVYEPRERIRVTRVSVENVGGMPTPEHTELSVQLERVGWVEPEQGQLMVPAALAPGQVHHFEDAELWFRIGDWSPRGPDDPLEEPETIRQRATLPSVRRDFEHFCDDRAMALGGFVIRFPVRSSDVSHLPSLAPGEVTRLRWTLTNQSRLPLGADSESGRVIRVRVFATESELSDDAVSLFGDGDRALAPSSGYSHEIRRLDAGESLELEIGLGMSASAEFYRRFGAHLALELGHLDEPADARPIQYRAIDVRCAKRFVPRDDADLLLVVNHRTTRDELAAWQQIAARLGFGLCVWDLSLERRLDLEAPVAANRSLTDHFAGKTIVILDNAISTPAGTRQPHEFLDKRQLHAAVAEGVNVALLGEGTELRELLVPTHEQKAVPRVADAGAAVTALARAQPQALAALSAVSREVEPTKWKFWGGVPDENNLGARAEDLSRRLHREFPDRRYVVVYEHAPEVVGKFLWIKKWRIGKMTIRGTLDTAGGAIVHSKVDPLKLSDPQYLLGDENLMTLMLTRGFDEKLGRLASLLEMPDALLGEVDSTADTGDEQDERGHLIGLLVDAMLVDLVHEQEAIVETGWRSGLSSDGIRDRLRHLRALARWTPPARLDPHSPDGVQLVRLVARLRFLAEANTSLWEMVPPLAFMRRGPIARRHTRRLCDELVEHAFPGKEHIADKLIAKRLDALHDEFKAGRKAYRVGTDTSKAQYARDLMLAPIAGLDITTDAEVLVHSSTRIYARQDYDAIAADDATAAARRNSAVSGADDARKDLLREQTFEQLTAD